MGDRPILPLVLQLSALFATAYYLLFFQQNAPGAILYAIVSPAAILGVGIFAYLHPRADRTWYARALWITLPIVLLNIPGTIVLHSLPLQYDRFLHLAVGFLVLLMAYQLVSLWSRPLRRALILTIAGLFIFEGFQWSSDRIIGTNMFSDLTQTIERDVTEDIAFGLGGALLAVAWVRKRSNR